VSPSLSENHGAAAEASAMGIPTLASNAGGLPELVTKAGGWCVQAGDNDALERGLVEAYSTFQHGTIRSRGEQARKYMVNNQDVDECSRLVADAIEDLVARHSL